MADGLPADDPIPVGLREAWFAADWERFVAEWESWTGGLEKSIRSTRSEVQALRHRVESFVSTSLELMDEALPPESAELAVMKAVTGWLTGEIGVPAAVAAVWSGRDGKRTWAEWDAWLWEQLQNVPTERLWPDGPPRSTSAWSYWNLAAGRMFSSALAGTYTDGGQPADVGWAKHVMEARAVLRAAAVLTFNDPIEIWHSWYPWLRRSLIVLEKRHARAGWEQYVQGLPPALREMAKVAPAEQAEVAAMTFELGAAHGYDLYFPPNPPEEEH